MQNRQYPRSNDFDPVFIVGAPRSGTTMLAVLLDRHSRISIPPETNFFSEFLPQISTCDESSQEDKVQAALSFRRIQDLEIPKKELLKRFGMYENDFPSLFRAILEAYSARQGKQRAGEKSPKHIEHVPTLLQAFPKAKIVLIVRDGRDVVRSLLKVAWAEPGNPRRFGLFCIEWNRYVDLVRKYRQEFSSTQLFVIKYEDILRQPEDKIREICQFIGEKFEAQQLNAGKTSTTVPGWEMDWKGKASQMLDPKRIEAWRNEQDIKKIWSMNIFMGKSLKYLGYPETNLYGCPWRIRLLLRLKAIPYASWCREYVLFALRLMRKARLMK